MPRWSKIAVGALALLALVLAWPAWQLYVEIQKAASDDPAVYEDDIRAFEDAAALESEPSNAVLFVGSSSIRLWSTLKRDMQPFPVIQRGFGGAKLRDVAHYTERLVNVWEPRAVVAFAGTNDVHPGAAKAPEVLLGTYQEFVLRVRADLPNVPIYYIAITPSPMRWEAWPIATETNALVQQYSELTPGLHFIDTGPALLGADGAPDPANYRFDRLHLSVRGYEIWTRIIRQRLLADLGA